MTTAPAHVPISLARARQHPQAHGPARPPRPSRAGATEATTTIVIGAGFSGLAVAAELNRQGVAAIVVEGSDFLKPVTTDARTGGLDLGSLKERTDILRLLEHYAQSHGLDIRHGIRAEQLKHGGPARPATQQWVVETAGGTLTAQNIVFTCGALNQLRRVLQALGITAGRELIPAMQAVGLHLVGVGALIAPTTREVLHQAKRVGQSISRQDTLPRAALAV